jgi:hypothetical protein
VTVGGEDAVGACMVLSMLAATWGTEGQVGRDEEREWSMQPSWWLSGSGEAEVERGQKVGIGQAFGYRWGPLRRDGCGKGRRVLLPVPVPNPNKPSIQPFSHPAKAHHFAHHTTARRRRAKEEKEARTAIAATPITSTKRSSLVHNNAAHAREKRRIRWWDY